MSRDRHSPRLLQLCALCLCATTLYGLPAAEKLTQLGRQNWQTENGLPQNTVHVVLQSSDGFLWLGTDGGLVRFDGFRFTTYDTRNTPALKSNTVDDLASDRTGDVWAATPDGIVRFHAGEAQAFTAAQGLPAARSWSVAADRNGQIVAASADGLFRFSGDRWVSVPFGEKVNALRRDQSNRLWAVTDTTIRALDGTGSYPIPSRIGIGRVRDVLLRASTLWVGTDRGVWELSRASAVVRRYSTSDGLPSDRITALLTDRDGALWVGTERGLARITERSVETFPSADPLSNDAVNSLYEDREGDIWIGADIGGLTILRRQKFITYSFREPDSSPQIRCVLSAPDGTVWIGTDGAGLKRLRNGQLATLTTADGLSSNVILSLALERDGTLLVGTPDGLNRVPDRTLRATEYPGQTLAEDFVRSLYVDGEASVWVGTRRGLSHLAAQTARTYTQADGLGSDTVGALLRDRTGSLWIGTLHGLSRMKDSVIHNFTTADGLSGNIVTDLYEDKEGSVWIATQDGGLNVWRHNSFAHWPASASLPQTIYGLTQDNSGALWMVAKDGIFRVDFSRGTPSTVTYGTSDGLRVSEGSGGGHPVLWRTATGDLWFATANGAALLPAAAQSLNRVLPPVVIETVSVDDRSYSPDHVGPVPAGKSHISFEYAGLSFLAPQKVEYKYRLDGFDRDWIDAGTRRVAYYTNLPPRTYHFRVRARNNDGFWNDAGATAALQILPHFYQTWWFYLLVLCAAGLGSYALYYWRLQQMHARFEAVLAERNRIAREIHDTLAQGFVGVSVQLELVSRLLTNSADNAREHLDQARILVRTSLAEARQSIWELRSQAQADADFAARFSKLAQQVSDSTPVKVHLEVHGQYRPLKPALEDELFRIGQEAINNAVRHSGAQEVRVNLAFDSKRFRMTIVDNGRGFSGVVNSEGPDGHFGLKGMRERAQRIHAELNLESTPGLGTTISVEAPTK